LLGLEIKHVGDYRSFQEQVNLFVSRYKPTSRAVYFVTQTRKRKRWYDAKAYGYSSTYWVMSGNFAMAAQPGTSNHGLGLALDTAEERDGDSGPEGISQRFVDWLVKHAHKYGISFEAQSEPWHLRYNAGDAIPSRTLAYEALGGIIPPEPTPPPEGDTYIVDANRSNVDHAHRTTNNEVHVKRVQSTLIHLWNQTDVGPIDGDFGPMTDAAVRNAQTWANAKGWANPVLVVDGEVGPKTWGVLENNPS
jgi:peptidoglycan hydrolase-like protein with peptidoglycan-binding domain